MIDVIIPVYKPDEKFTGLLKMLSKQTVKPDRIICTLTLTCDREDERVQKIIRRFNMLDITVIPVNKEDFDHGKTRNLGADNSKADYLMFMTQDAIPATCDTVEKLYEALKNDGNMAVAYGRQLPGKKAGSIEKYIRRFNYPPESRIKSEKDIQELGIKTFFCSNVCAMYRADIFRENGGFINHTIFNEDMIYASRIIKKGYKIGYIAEAKVVHSHKYKYSQEMSRNFDLGVSQKMYEEDFSTVSSESEGIKMILGCMKYLLRRGEFYMIPDLIIRSGYKFVGYRLGKNYKKMSKKRILKLSMNKGFWK